MLKCKHGGQRWHCDECDAERIAYVDEIAATIIDRDAVIDELLDLAYGGVLPECAAAARMLRDDDA